MGYIQRCKQAMRYIQRCKQRQWDIYKDVNKCNEMIYKDVNKGNEIYTKM